jgi:hypothetical protein
MFEVVPEPGAPFGPCRGACNHPECEEHRFIAALRCVDCGEPIGYGRRFYIESLDWSRLAHLLCAHSRFEHRRSCA